MAVGLTVGNSNLLMTKYRKKIVDAVKRHEGQFNKIPTIEGNTNRFEWAMDNQGISSLGFAVEGQAFPTPNAPSVSRPFVGYKVFNAAVQVTDVALALAKGDATSFRSASDHLIRSAVNQSMRLREVIHYQDGTGIQGVITGTVTAASTALSITYFDAVATSRSTDRTSINAGVWPGATYDIVDQTTLLVKGQITIASQNDPITSGTIGSFVLQAPGFPAAVATGDYLVWQGSFGLAYNGLSVLIDNDVSGTFQGITFSTDTLAKQWVSTVSSNGGTLRTLTPSLFIRALQGGFERMGNTPDGYSADKLEVLANPAMAEQFLGLYQVTGAAANSLTQTGAGAQSPNLVRLTPDSKIVGNSALAITTPFGDIKLVMKNTCPQDVIYGVDYSQLGFIQSQSLDWRPGVANMFTPSQIASVRTAQLYEVGECFVFDRRGMFKILDITTVAGNSGN